MEKKNDLSDIQLQEIEQIKEVIIPWALKHGFTETEITPINGQQVRVHHSKITRYGYKIEKTITINPGMDLKIIKESFI